MQALYDEIRNLRTEMNIIRVSGASEPDSLVKRDPVAVSLESAMSKATIHSPIPVPTAQDTNIARDPSQMLSEIQSLRSALTEANSRLSSLGASNSMLKRQLLDTSTLLQNRTKHLHTIEDEFMARSTSTPEQVVNGMIGELNAQVLKITDKLLESLKGPLGSTSGDKKKLRMYSEAAFQGISDIVGEKLVHVLLENDASEDTEPVHIALRSLLVNAMFTVYQKWPYMPTEESPVAFWGLYRDMRDLGTTAITISHSHSRHSQSCSLQL